MAASGSCMQYVPQSGQYASCLGGFLGLVLNAFSAVKNGCPGENNYNSLITSVLLYNSSKVIKNACPVYHGM